MESSNVNAVEKRTPAPKRRNKRKNWKKILLWAVGILAACIILSALFPDGVGEPEPTPTPTPTATPTPEPTPEPTPVPEGWESVEDIIADMYALADQQDGVRAAIDYWGDTVAASYYFEDVTKEQVILGDALGLADWDEVVDNLELAMQSLMLRFWDNGHNIDVHVFFCDKDGETLFAFMNGKLTTDIRDE